MAHIYRVGHKRTIDYVNVNAFNCKNNLNLLHDNQADICLIKLNTIMDETTIDKSDIINVIGITETPITAIGSFHVELIFDDLTITHPFYVVPNNINVPTDGILGKDFLKIKCVSIINHERMVVILKINGKYKEIPILESPNNSTNLLFTQITTDRNTNLLRELQLYKQLPNAETISLCTKFNYIFHLQNDKLSTNNFFQYQLKLRDADPVYMKNYRTAHSQKNEIDDQVNELLKSGQIEPSVAPYNSPLLLVPKKGDNGKAAWRLCVDFRGLNKKLINDTYPLPRMDDILDELGNNQFFSILDLKSGFHQIPLTEDSKNYTTFSTRAGSFRYTVLPFGLKVAPSAFVRMINTAFSSLPYKVCFTYLDDIIILGQNEQEHIENIEKVFRVCAKMCLKLNPRKCKFFETQVTYLGHICSQNGVSPDKSKFEAITNYPRPQTRDEAKRFIAFANYYRRFIKNFAALSAPINNLTRKSVDFKWTKDCETNFELIKSILVSPSCLQYPDFTQTFILTCDASKLACGAILSQMRNGHDVPIAYSSKSFTKGESHKAPIEQELLAIFYAVKHFRPYIYGTRFIIRSDHKPLVYLFSLKDPSSRLTRIRLDLEEYDFEIQYIKGETNVAADALSRVTVEDLKELNTYVFAITRSMTRALRDTAHSTQGNSNSIDSENTGAHNAQVSDQGNTTDAPNTMVYEPLHMSKTKTAHMQTHGVEDIINKRVNNKNANISIYKHVKASKPIFTVNLSISPDSSIKLGDALQCLDGIAVGHNLSQISMKLNDPIFKYIAPEIFKSVGNKYLKNTKILLTKTAQTIVDDEEKLKILRTFHDDPMFGGHVGQKRLLAKIASQFQWKNLRKDVASFVNKCHQCKVNKPKFQNIEPLCITPTPIAPFDRVIIDTIGPLVTSQNNNKYALSAICDLSKYVIIIPIPDKRATTVARAIMNEIILIYGPMNTLLSDKGTEFLNETISELCNLFKIQKINSAPYHHETVGSIERNHRNLNEYLRAYLRQSNSDWEELLKYFTFCHNATPHSSFDFIYSPFELVFSKKPINFFNNQPTTIEPIYNVDNFAVEAKHRLQVAIEHAKILLNKSKENAKKFYDRKAKPLSIKLGDQVVLNDVTRNKTTDPMYRGPFTVKEIKDFNLVLLNHKTNKNIEVHKNNVKIYK